jgi:hypothetical protein
MPDTLDTTDQRVALQEVLSAYRYEVTDFEAGVWLNIIKAVPRDRFIAFLQHHYQTSPYAPKPADATKYLDTAINPDMAFQRLSLAVSSIGPWTDPKISEPILLQTIHLMGGWSAVNEQMPDVSKTHEMRAFRERFNACFNTALAQIRIERIEVPEPLKGIGTIRSETRSLPIPKP